MWFSRSAYLLFVELVTARGQIVEARVLADKRQLDRTNRAITLLADDDLGDALVFGIRVIDLIAVNKHDDVGVLLDRPGFTQVGVHRALVRALFQ